jgi:hypothetical protein
MRLPAIIAAALLASPAAAQMYGSAQNLPGAPARPAAPPPGTITQLHEQFTVTTSSSDGVDSKDFTLDPSATATINCAQQCTVISDSSALVAARMNNNLVAICPEIDGAFTVGSCYQVVTAPKSDPSAHPVAILTNVTVPAGTHTLQVYLYSKKAASWTIRQTVYHVYY